MKEFFGVAYIMPFVKKGKKPAIMLYNVAGELPDHNVIAQEIADSEGFVVGNKYEVKVFEKAPHDVFGRQFGYKNLGEWRGSVLSAINEYGIPIKYIVRQQDFTSLHNKKKTI